MSMDDLKAVQAAGWTLIATDGDSTLAACPSFGCGVKVRIPHGKRVLSCDPGLNRGPRDIPIGSYEDMRKALRLRRQELELAIPEVEHIAGLARDHLAKAEKPNPTKLPNVDTTLWWAAALGYEVVLRPVDLPDIALRIISETRPQGSRRRALSRRDRASSR